MNYNTMVDRNITQKYAQAFMAVCPLSFTNKEISLLRTAQEFLSSHKLTLFFLQLPQFNEERRKAMVADLLTHFSLPQPLSKIILLLLKHNRSFYIPDVFATLIELYSKKNNSIEFVCKSTQLLSDSEQEVIGKFLQGLLNKNISLVPAIDHSLIAGLRLESSEYLWEYSIRKQIKALQALKRQD